MNNDKINSNISNYIFKKNKYSLSKPCNKINNKDLNFCKKFSIKNKKAGFNFKGNNNLCYLYKNYNPTNKIDDNLINNYNKRKFIKYEKQKNANIFQQNDPNFYFKELNHFNLHSTNLINKSNAQNLQKCMNHCLDNPDCNSFTYFQEPQECTFFDKINLANNKNINYDSYTLNKNLNNIDEQIEEEDNKEILIDNKPFIYNENVYTKCFTNENYKDYKNLIKNYNNICSREFGDEYTFSNQNDNKNIKKCDNNSISISCKPNYLEKFSNNDKYKNIKISIFVFFILLVLFLRIIIPTKTGRRIIIFIAVLFLLFILWITGYLEKLLKK